MKRLYTYLTIFTLGLVTLGACTDELEVYNYNDVEEGNDVTLKLSVKTETGKDIVVSRSKSSPSEKKLYDLHFYVFSGDKLIGYEKVEDPSGQIMSPGEQSIKIRTKTGAAYIYAVANINKGDTYFLNPLDSALLNVTDKPTLTYRSNTYDTIVGAKYFENDTRYIRKIVEDNDSLTRTRFLNIKFKRNYSRGDNQNFSPSPIDSVFMMSGYLYDGNQVTIKKEENTISIAENVNIINLYRILSKNKLTIRSNKQKGTFTPKSYRLNNVPKVGMLIPNTEISSANTNSADYVTKNGNIYHMTVDTLVETSYQKSTTDTIFEFYFPENLQETVSGIDKWKNREANSYATGNKVFTKAPQNAGYLEIQGDYVSKDGNTTANVLYTIHLGNFSNKERLGDFNVIRNNHYQYNVMVNGVDDIIAEAVVDSVNNTINKDSINPYAEGLVINAAGGKHYRVDAHYESRVMTFKKSSITDLKGALGIGTGYILNIKTPFGQTSQTVNVKADGVYTMQDSLLCTIAQISDTAYNKRIFQGEADFDWIRFVKNTADNRMPGIDEGDIAKYPCRYPGDRNEKQDIYGRWLNVFELLADLYKEATYTNGPTTDPEAYYTCFIDENYYYDKKWKEYVNKDDRSMLIANDLSVSEDGKSLYAEVEYSISQRSIWTFYTNENIRAFGTEIIDEEDKYHNKRATDLSTDNIGTRLGDDGNYQYEYYREKSISNTDDWNGWTSGANTNQNETWYDDETGSIEISTNSGGGGNSGFPGFPGGYPGSGGGSTTTEEEYSITIKKEGIQPLYRSVAKACMSRNRDLDGSGTVEQNEVRWYLAAIDQYRALYYAQGVMHPDAHFINNDELAAINTRYGNGGWGNDTNGHNYRGYYHYWTCSDEDVSGTFWPEEGLTNNPVEADWGVSRGEMVRCIRTLESATFDEDNELTAEKYGLNNPELFYSYTSDTRTFELNGIRVNRQPTTTSLGFHNETDDLNDFSTSFVVASNDLENGSTYSSSSVTTGSDLCLTYSEGAYGNGMWRTPNQKEMALMLSVGLISKDYDYGTRTQFTGHTIYSWHTSPGFISDNGSLNLTSTNVRLRCVRDK